MVFPLPYGLKTCSIPLSRRLQYVPAHSFQMLFPAHQQIFSADGVMAKRPSKVVRTIHRKGHIMSTALSIKERASP